MATGGGGGVDEPPPHPLRKYRLEIEINSNRDFFMTPPKDAFAAHGHDSHVFGHTTTVKFAFFGSDDCGRPVAIQIEASFRPETLWLDLLLAPQ